MTDVSRWTPRQFNEAERLVVKATRLLGDLRRALRDARRAVDEADAAILDVDNARSGFYADLVRVQEARRLLLDDENGFVERVVARVADQVVRPHT